MLNFMGIGAQKSGTSWLCSALSEHPKIEFPGGKEVHFWDQCYNQEVEWYINLFANDAYINGDITPAYGFLPTNVIQEIYALMPNLRLIYLIRNPIDRAWSSARMALARAEMLHEEASDPWFIDHFNSKGSLARGDYETCIRQWRSIFPEHQLLIVRYDDICHNPIAVANKCLNHLGLDNFFTASDTPRLGKKIFKGDGVSIRATLLPVLHAMYLEKIESLEKYLDDDFSDWKQI